MDSRSALPRKNMAWRRLRLVDRDNSFSLIFSGKIGFYSVGFRVCGATRWGQPTWARQERGALPGGLCPPRCPSPVDLGSRNSYLLHKNSSQCFVPFRELLFLHKNNTMVVLLKTESVWGQFHSNHANQRPKQEEKRQERQICQRRITTAKEMVTRSGTAPNNWWIRRMAK